MRVNEIRHKFPEFQELFDQATAKDSYGILVSELLVNSTWKATVCDPVFDEDDFFTQVERQLSRFPSSVKVKIVDTVHSDEPKLVKEATIKITGFSGLGSAPGESSETRIKQLEEQLNIEASKSNEVQALKIELIKQNFQREIDLLKSEQRRELELRDTRISSLLEQVDDLEAELLDADTAINGLEQNKANSMGNWSELLGSVLANGIETFCVRNPELLTEGLKISPEVLSKVFNKNIGENQVKIEEGSAENPNPVRRKATGDYEGVDQKQAEAIERIRTWLKMMPLAEFNIFWHIVVKLMTEDGRLYPEAEGVFRSLYPESNK
jgi:hypothetical protein